MSNQKDPDDDKNAVSSSRTELGIRLSVVIDRIGSTKIASRIVGVTPEQIGAWKKGRAKVPLEAGAKLAAAAEIHLEWLAHGRGPRDTNDVPTPSEGDEDTGQKAQLSQRLSEARDIYEDAVTAAGHRPSRELEGLLVALILKGRFNRRQIEDIALFLDTLKRE